MKKKDLSKKRFGSLVVISENGRDKWNKIKYLCECDCGNKPTVARGSLVSGDTKSCGCLRGEKRRTIRSENHLSCKEYKKKYMSEYYKENRDKLLKNSKVYSKRNTDKVAEVSARKRARKRNQTPILTENEKRKVGLYYQIAVYLGGDFHVDHIHPLSKGGLHHPDNLQILTAEVNMEKHNKWPLTEAEKIKYKGIRI